MLPHTAVVFRMQSFHSVRWSNATKEKKRKGKKAVRTARLTRAQKKAEELRKNQDEQSGIDNTNKIQNLKDKTVKEKKKEERTPIKNKEKDRIISDGEDNVDLQTNEDDFPDNLENVSNNATPVNSPTKVCNVEFHRKVNKKQEAENEESDGFSSSSEADSDSDSDLTSDSDMSDTDSGDEALSKSKRSKFQTPERVVKQRANDKANASMEEWANYITQNGELLQSVLKIWAEKDKSRTKVIKCKPRKYV